MSDWKPYEPTIHRFMGAIAMLTNTRWLWLHRREMRQLPPENDRYPVVNVDWDAEHHGNDTEYWSKSRVMDTLNDLGHEDQGGTIMWFGVVGLAMWAGWAMRGWLG